MTFDLSQDLNSSQQAAVRCLDKCSLILAGAGSGKTRVLTHKVLHIIQSLKVNPKKILMITFTNKAAAEMKRRVKQNLGFIGTFHALCVRILRIDGQLIDLSKDFVIYDQSDQQDVVKEILKQKNHFQKYTPSYFLNRISYAKNQLIEHKDYPNVFKDYSNEIISEVYQAYQKTLKKNKAVDFDDLIMQTAFLFQKHPQVLEKWQACFPYILVDEFQDTNYAQYMLVKYLGKKYKKVTVVGDFSQSIYSWRGAEIKNLEKFQKDFPETQTFYLEQNYRSTQNILDFAYQIISQNQTHPVLQLFTQNQIGEKVRIEVLDNEQYEALYVADEIQKLKEVDHNLSTAVLYRTNAQSRVIEEAFLHLGLPYVLIGGTRFYERKEIRDILSFTRLIVNPDDAISQKRVLKVGKKRSEAFFKFVLTIHDRKLNLSTIEIIDQILATTSYLQLFSDTDTEDISRLENIKELRSVAVNFPNIQQFLEQVALVESEYFENEKKQKEKNVVQMMTLHQAKGLEFSYVFIVGVEDGLLPHSKAFYDQFNLEEECRLFYVGATRAQKKLYLTYVKKRFIFGKRNHAIPSRFLTQTSENEFT